MKINSALNKLKDKLFSNIHLNNLVYNTCWEDPRIDKQLMQLTPESNILMITSAGCNALDYLLDNPNSIDCVDVNPRQNALLELKIAAIKKLQFDDFFQLFGKGNHPMFKEIYKQTLRPELPEFAQEFWDKKNNYFSPNTKKKSFYFKGTSGQFAWLFSKYLKANKKVKKAVYQILEAQTIEEQKEIYKKIEPYILKPFVKWVMNRHITMSLLGVPRMQQNLIKKFYPEGMSGYLKQNLKHIFTELPLSDNYFWRLYITGCYTAKCCPNYLKPEKFNLLKQNIHKIKTYTQTLSEKLESSSKKYSHYVLLDHQDWLAAHDIEGLNKEWLLILANSTENAKVLMRSALMQINFIPEFATKKLKYNNSITEDLHQKDRVGTYASTFFAQIVLNSETDSN